jgi:hypothetical protein
MKNAMNVSDQKVMIPDQNSRAAVKRFSAVLHKGFAAERGNEQQAVHSCQTCQRTSDAGEPPLTPSRREERAESEREEKTFGIANVKNFRLRFNEAS